MKIELQLTNDQLMAINNQLQKVYEMPVSTDQRENVYKSIAFDLADKFDKKCKNLIKKASLFSQKKKIKISLKFHEAWALQAVLMELIIYMDNEYQKTLIQKTINALDEKLC